MSTAIRVLEKCAFAAGGEDGDPQTVAGREDNRLRARVGASGRIALMSFPGRGLPDLTASGPRIRSKAHVHDGQPSFTPNRSGSSFARQGPADRGLDHAQRPMTVLERGTIADHWACG
jgi:hypothetical protein